MLFSDEIIVSAAVLEHLSNRAFGDGGAHVGGEWWACFVRRGEQEPIWFRKSQFTGEPYEAKKAFAMDMCRALNRWIDHGGAWVVQWTHPKLDGVIPLTGWDYQRFHFVWLDEDGDPMFGSTCDDRFSAVLREKPDKWILDAEEAWNYAQTIKTGWIDPLPGEQFKAAQGQPVPKFAKPN